jgi:putative transcriptional regulator
MDDGDSLSGQLLIAAPGLLDPNFFRTVVLLIEHGAETGAVGVVLNRRGDQDAGAALPELAGVLDAEERLHEGGPVQTESVIALGEYVSGRMPGEARVLGDIGVLTGDLDIVDLPDLVRRARVFLGYAGWAPGQLEGELEQEAWFVEPAIVEDVFAERPDELWRRVLERKGGQYRLLARIPDDPRVN